MAFTRSKRSTNPSSRIKIGGAIINPGIGELGAIDDSLRDDYPGTFAFNAFNGSTDSKGTAHTDTWISGEFDDVRFDTIQHSIWFRDTGSTTT